MTAKPTGHYTLKPDGLYLQFDRLFFAPIVDVWFSLTNPMAMQAWIGTYTGRSETGGVRFRMTEEGADWINVSILECVPPHRLLADSGPAPDGMRVFFHLHHARGMTTLTLGQRLWNPADAPRMGPHWDYYLDRLTAIRGRHPMPAREQYHPRLAQHYRDMPVPQGART